MKNTILIVLLFMIAGCSFSKNKNEDPAVRESRVDEVMNDQRYSYLNKVETGLKNADWDMFSKALPYLKKEDLNTFTNTGESLGIIAVRLHRVEYLKALLEAGMSPFQESFVLDQGGRNGHFPIYALALRVKDRQAADLVKEYMAKYYSEASSLCASSKAKLIAFLEANLISPLDSVCGSENLIENMINAKSMTQDDLDLILRHYLDVQRSDSVAILSSILDLSVKHSSLDTLEKLDIACSGRYKKCVVEFNLSVNWLPDLDKTLDYYDFLRKGLRLNLDLVTNLERFIFQGIKNYPEEDQQEAMLILEKHGLKEEYLKLSPELPLNPKEKTDRESHGRDGSVLPSTKEFAPPPSTPSTEFTF